MPKKDTLIDLLDADFNRAGALLMMQVSISDGEFEYAMGDQFEFLYWDDEFSRLLHAHNNSYWDALFVARGLVL